MNGISAVVITLNEAKHIQNCLASLEGIADEMIVVDAGSTDGTRELAEAMGAKVFVREFAGYGDQKNWGNEQAKHNWILSIDADESLSPELKASILGVKVSPGYDAFEFARRNLFCGKWVKHGGWYPDRKLRLWNRHIGSWDDAKVHEKVNLKSHARVGRLEGDLIHDSFESLTDHLDRIKRYSKLAAIREFERGTLPSLFKQYGSAAAKFFSTYFLKLGILDGKTGWYIAKHSAYARYRKFKELRAIWCSKRTDPDHMCFINSTKFWGGGEKWHLEAAAEMAARGHEVYLIAHPDSELAARMACTDIRPELIPIRNLSFLNPLKLMELALFFKRHRIGTVILNGSADLKCGGIAAKFAGVPRIIYRRGSAIPIKRSFLNKWLFKRVVTEVIANSEATKETVLRNLTQSITADRVQVHYNGVDFAELDALVKPHHEAHKPVIIGNLGRLVAQKGQHHLIQLVRELRDRGVSFKLRIGGEGPKEESLRLAIKKYDLEDVVEMVGFVNDVPEFMSSLDLFVLTSHWEGFGYVLVEAMAQGNPVVAFDISSNPEIVTEGKTGYLVEAFDEASMAECVARLIQNRQLRERMGQAAIQDVHERFDHVRQHDRLEAFLMNEPVVI
ncbi:glycosyltransferase [Pontibacter sp. G13]|uniref:glycosyltransferase n=1 Tax=Pontibacter sp. G13 TaxID=3074898 RepID=UPI00288B407C|nr:glycosyltransferase [Pontibacter sp. G13]WNJ16988.1 glycosyltransferase [Pontibacter sp. G13]